MSSSEPPPPSPAAAAPPPTPPPEGYSVELYFDPALENQVLKAWNILARLKISTHLINIGSRPHITLFSSSSSSSSLDPSRLLPALRSFAARHQPLPLTLPSLCAFTPSAAGAGDGVLFLAPSPSSALLHLQSQLCDAFKKEGVEIGEGYRPDSWVPHCPVAQEVSKEQMTGAFSVLLGQKLPVSGYAMEIALVQSPPVVEMFCSSLGVVSET